jgi:D-arginine dehydrogenase
MALSASSSELPDFAEVVVIGAGFAGASTAAALARAGEARGVLLEREPVPGSYASGRNAAIVRQVETEPILRTLVRQSVRLISARPLDDGPALRPTGGLYLTHDARPDRPAEWVADLCANGVTCELLSAAEARRRFPFLSGLQFAYAVFSPGDGVLDIHGLLTNLLAEARRGGVHPYMNCPVEAVLLRAGQVRGVRTPLGEIRTDVVVDATGAWAGRLGREGMPLPLQPLRRHLFVADSPLPPDTPIVWDLDAGYYFRPEGDGLLLSPCDETPHPPAPPAADFAAAELLAEKLDAHAPALSGVAIRRHWPCLRTFAPDRLPVIGWDPDVAGLFHVAGLGGFGAACSLAIGEAAAGLIRGRQPGWIDTAEFSPARAALRHAVLQPKA